MLVLRTKSVSSTNISRFFKHHAIFSAWELYTFPCNNHIILKILFFKKNMFWHPIKSTEILQTNGSKMQISVCHFKETDKKGKENKIWGIIAISWIHIKWLYIECKKKPNTVNDAWPFLSINQQFVNYNFITSPSQACMIVMQFLLELPFMFVDFLCYLQCLTLEYLQK